MVLADPLFWLALSFLLVVISLTAVLLVAIPAFRELGRAARSAEKFFDTLGRELPPTLEAIRLTGLEITELTDDVTAGVQSAGQMVQQVNQGITTAQQGAQRLNTGTKSLFAGAKAAWQAWRDQPPAHSLQSPKESPKATSDQAAATAPKPLAEATADDRLGASAPDSHDQGEGDRGDRSLKGKNNLPRLRATELRPISEGEADSAYAVESPELSSRRPAPDGSAEND